jgi:hypothetical protein
MDVDYYESDHRKLDGAGSRRRHEGVAPSFFSRPRRMISVGRHRLRGDAGTDHFVEEKP